MHVPVEKASSLETKMPMIYLASKNERYSVTSGAM